MLKKGRALAPPRESRMTTIVFPLKDCNVLVINLPLNPAAR
jgi:hypothetical protein